VGLNHHLLKAPEGRSSLNSCLINCTVVIGSKSLYCIYFGASWTVFSVITSPNRNLSGYNLKYKWGGTVRTHIRKMVEIAPRSSASGCQNVFCFFVIKTTRPFGHLSCTDFEHFWSNRRESLSACVHRWKISEFLRREFFRSQNSPKYGTLGWGVGDRAAAQTAQLWAIGIILGASRHR